MGAIRETLVEAGYEYCFFDRAQQCHVLFNLLTRKKEAWFTNRGHANYGITWRNTDLEFAREYFNGKT